MGPVLLGGSRERRVVSVLREVPLLEGRSAGTEGEFKNLRGEHSNTMEGNVERDLRRRPKPLPGTPQPGILLLGGA